MPLTNSYEPDRSYCPYFHRTGDGPHVCAFQCYDEPRCITDEPSEGWPSMRQAEKWLNFFGDNGLQDDITWGDYMRRVGAVHDRIREATERIHERRFHARD